MSVISNLDASNTQLKSPPLKKLQLELYSAEQFGAASHGWFVCV